MQVYRIYNKENQKSYVGITKYNFKTRYQGGNWSKWTHSRHLKKAVEKYGLESFVVEILEDNVKNYKTLCELEVEYIKKYNSFIPNGYNLTNGGSSENPSHIKKYELVDLMGKIHKIENLSKFCWDNGLNYGAMLNMVSGVSTSSQGYALKGTPVNKISTRVIAPTILENLKTGEICEIPYRKLRKWCDKRKLSYQKIQHMANGGRLVAENWKIVGTKIPKDHGDKRKYKDVELVNIKTGEEIIVENIYRFCEENNFSRNQFYGLIKEESLQACGYRLKKNKDFKRKTLLRRGKSYSLYNIKTKSHLEIKNLSLFCREHELNLGNMQLMVDNKISVYQDWTVSGRDLSSFVPKKRFQEVILEHEDGRRLKIKSPKELNSKHKGICCSQYLYEIIRGEQKNYVKGWRVKSVKYEGDFYPDKIFN